MKKNLIATLIAFSFTAHASITISSTDVKWVIGNTWTMFVTSGANINTFTKTGTGVLWDLTSYENSSTIDTIKVLNATAGANSTIKIKSDVIGGINYEPLTNDWGMETAEVLGNEFAFGDGSHALGFPHLENSTWNSTSSAPNFFSPIPQTVPTSLSGSVIATGQVVTTYGTFNALLIEENFSVPAYSVDKTYYYWETKEYGRIATLIDEKFNLMKNNNFDPVITVSNNTLIDQKLNIFPNPSDGTFTVESTVLDNIKLFDAIGNLVLSETVNGNSINLNKTTLKSGIYFLQTSANGNFTTSRIVVK